MYFRYNKIETNKLYRLPNKATDLLLDDISKFWTLEETYKKYNRVFRRNYLLYSAPGTGKTSLINLMCQELIEKYDGIVFSLTCGQDIELYRDAIQRVRAIEPDRKIITIIEDIDNFLGERSSFDTYLLNILDGNLKFGNLVTIATTNYIEKMEARYKNRPSRFDRVVEFPLPNDESRKIFIEKTVLSEDLSKIDIDNWVRKTEGYTIDHINELILLYFVFGHTEEESFETINSMVKNNNYLKNEVSENKRKIGFSNDESYCGKGY
jgi:SpoVK/Ycf46/Vps4 family AAA+-type ATPase